MKELLIFGLIMAASAIHNWIKRRQEAAEAAEAAEPGEASKPSGIPSRPIRPQRPMQRPVSPPPQSPTPMNWEEELRRLLQGEPVSAPPVTPPPSPARTPIPPPLVSAETAVPPPSEPSIWRSNRPLSSMRPMAEGTEMETGLPVAPVAFRQSSGAHTRAAGLSARVREQMKQASDMVGSHIHAAGIALPSPEAMRLRKLLQDRSSVRTLIAGSIILGPPKALERA